MKCPNCGAEGLAGKFCQHCGTKLPEEAAPTTIAGAIHGIAKTYLDQAAEKEQYERSAEFEEKEARKRKAVDKRFWKGIGLLIGVIAIAFILLVLDGQFHFLPD